ncbi:DUF5034 domain-containing protein [Pedobacter sp.]|uniref:DUF5034 domain-containing protein n=1 Tax=Pedobacter sp. TaxID=1411316 RepID=UPI003BAA3E32
MIKKIIFLLGIAMMSQLMVACIDCNCPKPQNIYFTNNGLALKNMDRSLPSPMLSSAGTIAAANYGIHIQVLNEQLTAQNRRVKWSLMQAAYACSCEGNYFISKESISAIQIFSNNDFDSSHPKGTDLSLYFKVNHFSGMISVTEYIKTLKDLNYSNDPSIFTYIFLQNAPGSNKKHKFRIVFSLSDGRSLLAETTEVELA